MERRRYNVETIGETAVGYRSGQQRARLTTLFFWATIAVSGVLVPVTAWEFNLWGRIGAAAEVSLAEAELSDGVSMVLGLLDLGILIGSGITFLMWFHRVRANLPALGISDARWSPRWAVGWWFVPVMSLFRPYQVAAEIWRASDPVATPMDWTTRPVAPVLGWWWGLFITSVITDQISFRMWMRVDENTPSGFMQNLAALDIVTAVIDLVGAWLAIQVIAEIERRQTDRSRLLAFT